MVKGVVVVTLCVWVYLRVCMCVRVRKTEGAMVIWVVSRIIWDCSFLQYVESSEVEE